MSRRSDAVNQRRCRFAGGPSSRRRGGIETEPDPGTDTDEEEEEEEEDEEEEDEGRAEEGIDDDGVG